MFFTSFFSPEPDKWNNDCEECNKIRRQNKICLKKFKCLLAIAIIMIITALILAVTCTTINMSDSPKLPYKLDNITDQKYLDFGYNINKPEMPFSPTSLKLGLSPKRDYTSLPLEIVIVLLRFTFSSID